MKVKVIQPYNSHAMMNWAAPILTNFDIVEEEPDITYHIPWHTLIPGRPDNSIQVMNYTHLNPGMEKELLAAVTNADAVICVSEAGVREIKALGTRTKPVRCINHHVDDYGPRKIRVGIVGSEQPNGRKGAHQLIDLAWAMDLSPFIFHIVGTGWEYVTEKLGNMGVEFTNNDFIPNLRDFYAEMDVILCTGHTEGGPVPLIEALACGKSVIAGPGGLADDLLPNVSVYHTIPELKALLTPYVTSVMVPITSVSHMTVANFVDDHRRFFNSLTNAPITNRYDHVDAIIRETGALNLMEIGTWTGQRALTMIRTAQEGTDKKATYIGFDLFEDANDEKLAQEGSSAKRPLGRDEVFRRLSPTGARIDLIKGDTKQTMHTFHSRESRPIRDFIYIDGGHSWETIASDWKYAQEFAGPHTTFLLDDYYENDDSEVEGIGCQKLIQELWGNVGLVVELLDPVETWPQPWGDLKIRMVKVTTHGITD